MNEIITPDNIIKIITIVVSVITAYKTFTELVAKKKEKLRADYEFAEKFIADGKWEKIHDYLLERGYWGLSGKQLEASVIRYFLTQKDPLGKLSDYTRGSKFLEPKRDNGNKVTDIHLKSPLNNERKYKLKYLRVSVGYFVFAFMSLWPVIFISNFFTKGYSSIAVFFAWILSFGMLAYLCLEELWGLQSAQRISKTTGNSQIHQDK